MNVREKRNSVVSRRLGGGDFNNSAIRVHARLAGEVVWAWNELHSSFSHLFIWLVDPDNTIMGMKLWTVIANETAQRGMLREAAMYSRALNESDRQRVSWVIKQADKLAVYRNDIVHGHIGFTVADRGVTTSMSYVGNNLSRILRYGQIELSLDKLMPALRGDLMALAGYVSGLARSGVETHLGPPRFARPRRPQLTTFRLVEEGRRKAKASFDEFGD